MPEKTTTDTIYSFATAEGRGGVSILRLSGAEALGGLRRLTRVLPPRAREMSLREVVFSGEVIDRGLVIFFRAPHSWTGEDVVEFHLHGGRAIRQAMVRACEALGLRQAEAGEFSKRAFLNGKADLTELEGLADLVDAETEAQRKQALRQMGGEARKKYDSWRAGLLSLLAQLEGQIDFPEDTAGEQEVELLARVSALRKEMSAELSKPYGERLREGAFIALLGGTNAGKSTLFNLLVGREAAIVSPHAGTTRDVLEAGLDLGGYPVILSDLAGLRESGDSIEREGVRRAELCAREADLRVIILAPDVRSEENDRALSFRQEGDIVMVNKKDKGELSGNYEFKVSLTNLDESFDEFNKRLMLRVSELCGLGSSALITRERHRRALEECVECLSRLPATLEGGEAAPELIAEDIRLALSALGRITGAVDIEEMLDELFAQFCIGK